MSQTNAVEIKEVSKKIVCGNNKMLYLDGKFISV